MTKLTAEDFKAVDFDAAREGAHRLSVLLGDAGYAGPGALDRWNALSHDVAVALNGIATELKIPVPLGPIPEDEPDVSPSEALFAFMGWLTGREETSGPFSSAHEVPPAPDLVGAFCESQGFAEPRDGWADRLKPYPVDVPDDEEPDPPQLVNTEEPTNPAPWPDPTPEMLDRPAFQAIWSVIKGWDVNVPDVYAGYCGATGNHVRAILDALGVDGLELRGPQGTKYLDVVFDGPPGPEAGRFVEVEDDQGKSRDVGNWTKRDGVYWALRLPVTDTTRADRLELIAHYVYAWLVEHGVAEMTTGPFIDQPDGVAAFRAALRGFDTDRLNSQQSHPLAAQMRTVADRLWLNHGTDGPDESCERSAYVGSLRTLAAAIAQLETAGTMMLGELDVALPVDDDSPGRMPLSEECRRAAAREETRQSVCARLVLMADMLEDVETRARELLDLAVK